MMKKKEVSEVFPFATQDCVTYASDECAMVEADIALMLESIPGWHIECEETIPRLIRVYDFPGYLPGLEFVTRIGLLSEKQDHHPRITLEWGKVTVEWWTHVVNGIHMNDFVMAAHTDMAYQQGDQKQHEN
jgi:4a-hydroxytetrahydrobiopterin dehydratase